MMMLRYKEMILSFPNMQIIWIPGAENIISDKLSRLFPKEQDRITIENDEEKLFPHLLQDPIKVIKKGCTIFEEEGS
jgi:hypothetical protein